MQSYIVRIKEEIITKHLGAFPAVALLGARQVGKSTLAKRIIKDIADAVYLDKATLLSVKLEKVNQPPCSNTVFL